MGTLGQLLECYPTRLLTSQPGRLPQEGDTDAVVTLAVRLKRTPVRHPRCPARCGPTSTAAARLPGSTPPAARALHEAETLLAPGIRQHRALRPQPLMQ